MKILFFLTTNRTLCGILLSAYHKGEYVFMESVENQLSHLDNTMIRDKLLSDDIFDLVSANMLPLKTLMAYYQCAIMEVETKFRVLNEEFSLQYDRNPIESIKTRLKSIEGILKKLRRKNLPLTLASIEQEIRDVAGIRVICSFKEDIYMLANCLLEQDDITLIERKDYIEHPKESGYRSLHLIIEVPIFLQNEKRPMKVEVQLRTIAMDFWASLEHKLRYKKNIPAEQLDELSRELYSCAENIASIDERMNGIHIQMERTLAEQEAENKKKKWPLLPGLS